VVPMGSRVYLVVLVTFHLGCPITGDPLSAQLPLLSVLGDPGNYWLKMKRSASSR